MIPVRSRLSAATQAVRVRLAFLAVLLVTTTHRGAPDLFALSGGLLIAVGAGLIALPAGLIVGGVFLATFGIMLDIDRARGGAA